MNLNVVFSPKMVASSQGLFSPSAAKPAQVVEDWIQIGLPLRIVEPVPATVEDFSLAHDRRFVESILSLESANGFGTRTGDVASSLPYTTGAMLTGAKLAISERTIVAVPCSGFHHAGWDWAAGFCTFNGLAVTALALIRDGLAKKVGIVDCDMHWGDGTDAIIQHLNCGSSIKHFSAGEKFRFASHVVPFFQELESTLQDFADCDVILYQAGADPHVEDPLGGWLTTDQLRLRDRFVFQMLRRLNMPVVWNLAGGYQRDANDTIEPVLQIHRNTAIEHSRSLQLHS